MVQTLSGQWYLWLVPLFLVCLLFMIPASLLELGIPINKRKKTKSKDGLSKDITETKAEAAVEDDLTEVLIAAAAAYISSQKKYGGNKMRNLKITINGKTYDVTVEEENGGYEYTPRFSSGKTGASPVKTASTADTPSSAPAAETAKKPSGDGTKVEAPMSGRVVEICVKEGDSVKAGDAVIVMEAMKLQSEICADCDGTVQQILVKEKQDISTGDTIVLIV